MFSIGPTDPGLLFTVLTAAAVLSTGLGSAEDELSVAVFVIEPALPGLPPIVTVTFTPVANVPRLHVTTPALVVQLPWVVCAETKVIPGGNGSVNTALPAEEVPRLVSVIE